MDRKLARRFWSAKRIVRFAGGGLLLFVILYVLITADSQSRLNVETERLTVSTVERGPFQFYIPETGTVVPIRTYYLDAMEGGRVERVVREAGSFVERGDTILILANTNLQLDIMNREAQFFEQRNNLRNTRLAMEQNSLRLEAEMAQLDWQIKKAARKFEQDSGLMQQNLISKADFEESRDEYEYLITRRELTVKTQTQDSVFRSLQIAMLEASVDRIQANLEFVRQNVENLCLRAPVSGHLTSLNADVGVSIMRGQRLGQIDILDGFKVRVDVDELYITRIDIGLPGEFELAGTTYELSVTKVYPEVQNNRFQVDMEFTDAVPEDIRRGQTLHIRMELDDLTEAVLLPRGGFHQTTGGNWVFVVDESEGVATKRDIRLGRKNPKVFEVLEGLEPGERVITSPYEYFGDVDKLVLSD
ncbi:MAG: HlyD family efflux transporter periplasmic adaptor subunit [Candidatus Zixiibacteriota bacterium]|nr:MAG: HlyD family efflux transporter periplasmic adaptor subunit [candidate division Zixibacteria bacterium]